MGEEDSSPYWPLVAKRLNCLYVNFVIFFYV